mmetsp:Transcript_82029/g.206383  ORF Transcript_82029/g.206383 Transcript_82029/m.206383 type:complete len:252 (+) Transcript_82029:490-1245(+)
MSGCCPQLAKPPLGPSCTNHCPGKPPLPPATAFASPGCSTPGSNAGAAPFPALGPNDCCCCCQGIAAPLAEGASPLPLLFCVAMSPLLLKGAIGPGVATPLTSASTTLPASLLPSLALPSKPLPWLCVKLVFCSAAWPLPLWSKLLPPSLASFPWSPQPLPWSATKPLLWSAMPLPYAESPKPGLPISPKPLPGSPKPLLFPPRSLPLPPSFASAPFHMRIPALGVPMSSCNDPACPPGPCSQGLFMPPFP